MDNLMDKDQHRRSMKMLKAPDSGAFSVVETKRIELSTPALQRQCSAN
jgi:hypothetical protein